MNAGETAMRQALRRLRDWSPGWWTHIALWVMVVVVGHKVLTPEVGPPLKPGDAHNFRVAAFPRTAAADAPPFIVMRLDDIERPGAAIRDVTFLAPADSQRLPGGDLNEAKVV